MPKTLGKLTRKKARTLHGFTLAALALAVSSLTTPGKHSLLNVIPEHLAPYVAFGAGVAGIAIADAQHKRDLNGNLLQGNSEPPEPEQ